MLLPHRSTYMELHRDMMRVSDIYIVWRVEKKGAFTLF